MLNLALTFIVLSTLGVGEPALPGNTAEFEPGRGLNFTFDEGRHTVGIGAFIQPSWKIENLEGSGSEQFWNAKRAHLSLGGSLSESLIQFEIELDFSDSRPLLDAWMSYAPWSWLTLSFGQKQTSTNNREMMQGEGFLSFAERGLLSRAFSVSGRELGLYVDAQVDVLGMSIRPKLSMTSGDGRNSFGVDSRDVDQGALKWGARLDVYPLGDFSEGNQESTIDLVHEESLKILIGGAFSYNDGTSHPSGEGHGDLVIYDTFGDRQLPDYIQIYADMIMKFEGFSLMAEFANTSATSLQGTFTDQNAANPLYSGQISEFLALGNGLNVQLGYYFSFGMSIDARYGMLTPAFAANVDSVIQETMAYDVGVSGYFLEHSLKVQANVSRVEVGDTAKETIGEIIFQVML